MSMNAGKRLKNESQYQWMRGDQAEEGTGRNDVYRQSSHRPHHHPTSSYYSQPSAYPHSASSDQSWTSNEHHRPMSFVTPHGSYMSDVLPADPTQYMDMFAPTNAYAYNSYASGFFAQPHHMTGAAGGEGPFWGQPKHPLHGADNSFRTPDVSFFGSSNQQRCNHNDDSIESGMNSLHIDGHENGYSASNGQPSSGSEVSDFSTEQDHHATYSFQAAMTGNIQRQGRKTNQSWASVASQPVRSSLRAKHSLPSRRLLPAPNADAIVAWDQNPSSNPKSVAAAFQTVDPLPASSQVSEKMPDNVQQKSVPRKNAVPSESSSWLLMNDRASPPLRLETKSLSHNSPSSSAVTGVRTDNIERVTIQKRPIVAIKDPNRDPVISGQRAKQIDDAAVGSQTSSSLENPKSSHASCPDEKLNAGRSFPLTATLKPVIDSSALKDRQKLEHIFNPKEFDLNPPDARFFVIKSYSEDDIHRSIKYSIWCSTERGNKRLDVAFRKTMTEGGVIYLFFSVNGSGHFCGMAQMLSALDYNSSANVWAQDKWKGQFKVRWIYVKDVPNGQLRHIRLENNENKPVTNSRDTQEVPSDKGQQVLNIIHSFKHTTSIFDDFLHYEKRQEEESHRRVDAHDGHVKHPVARDKIDTRSRDDVQQQRSHRDNYSADVRSDYRRPFRSDHQIQSEGRRNDMHSYNQDQNWNRGYQRPHQRDGAYERRDRNDQNHFSRPQHQQPLQRSE